MLFSAKNNLLPSSTQPTVKQSLIIFALLLSASFAHSQSVGLGIGSGGLAIKSNPNNNWRFAARLDLQLTDNFNVTSPSVMVVRQIVNEEHAKFYSGAELGARIATIGFETAQATVRIPVGVEYFPFEDIPVSGTIEGGLNFYLEPENNVFFIGSQVEVSYYFGR